MWNAPSLIVFVVMVIQTPRVSEFGVRIGAPWILAVVFALFLTFSTFTLSFFKGRTEGYIITAKNDDLKALAAQRKMAALYKQVNNTATFWLVLFVLIEGMLNLAETMSHLHVEVGEFSWEWFGAIAYGIFPTLAAYGMGTLQALISKLPIGAAGKSQIEQVFDALMRYASNALDAQSENAKTHTTHKTQDAPKVKRNLDAYPKPCPHCGASQPNSNAYSAHMRWQHPEKKNQPVGFNLPQPVNKATSATTTAEKAPETTKIPQ